MVNVKPRKIAQIWEPLQWALVAAIIMITTIIITMEVVEALAAVTMEMTMMMVEIVE